MTRRTAAVLALAAALCACRAKPLETAAEPEPAFAAPAGKRGVAVAVDKSQTRFLNPGDAAEVVILIQTPRADGMNETRSEVLSARAEVLRIARDWSDDDGLVMLALTPEEAQYAALTVDRQDRLFLNKLPDAAKLEPAPAPSKPALAAGRRGLAALVYADQQEFLAGGDRVDVIATRESGKASGKSELVAITLLQNVTVLGAGAPEGNDQWATVQLELTPEQAKTLTGAVASEDNLILAVRPEKDAETRPVEPSKMSRKFGTDAERRSPKS